MIYVQRVHMVPSTGYAHEHIAEVEWRNTSDNNIGRSTTPNVVDFIDNKNGDVRVRSTGSDVQVGTVHQQGRASFIRTHANGVWTDNLLALPRY